LPAAGAATITAPPGDRTRPTTDRVREAWMSALQHDLPGARVLDLFAGSGALGLEALSRGAAHVTFVERGGRPAARAAGEHRRARRGRDVDREGDALRYVEARAVRAVRHRARRPAVRQRRCGQRLSQRSNGAVRAHPAASSTDVAQTAAAARPGARTRRYGDTAITFITAPQ
jgi:16S rRNA (guanine966-N2)-methyltransferase